MYAVKTEFPNFLLEASIETGTSRTSPMLHCSVCTMELQKGQSTNGNPKESVPSLKNASSNDEDIKHNIKASTCASFA